MSAEVAPAGLDAPSRSRPADVTMLEVDALLDATFAELVDALRLSGAVDGATGGPLHVDLVAELAERTRNHGKRLRPVLAHWGWALARGDGGTHRDLVRVGAALELLHLFALVQDDVMDRSASRRGRPTLHVVAARRHRAASGLGDPELFGDSVATLVSDLALSEATLLVASTRPEVRARWRVMAVELVEGQLLDVTHTAGRRRHLETSLQIARFKSGRYTITRPLQLGALVAGAPRHLVDGLETWGDLVGDAFAVRDDVLGCWGDPARTGKPAGDDLRSGKPTVLLTWAEERLPRSARGLLAACDDGRLDDHGVTALQQAMLDAGVRALAEETVTDLVARAHGVLDDLDVDPEADSALRDLADSIAWRAS